MNPISRAQFIKALIAGAFCLPYLELGAVEVGKLRGDRVGWARLKTPSEHWRRHSDGDPSLMQFIRAQTTLNIDPTWYVADVQKLDALCQYPLLFSQGVNLVQDGTGRQNLAEFMRRGGFLLIDACCNRAVTPNDDVFLAQQKAFVATALPEARVVALPADHKIYNCHFQIPNGHPPHTYEKNIYDPQRDKHGLYSLMIGQRMVGVITLSGLQCGWARMIAPPGHDVACMKMLVNIYTYAMLQGG